MSEELTNRIMTHDYKDESDLNEDAVKLVHAYDELSKQLADARAEVERLHAIINDIWDMFYGQNFTINNWHQNGDVQPIDSFFEENDWSIEQPLEGGDE